MPHECCILQLQTRLDVLEEYKQTAGERLHTVRKREESSSKALQLANHQVEQLKDKLREVS